MERRKFFQNVVAAGLATSTAFAQQSGTPATSPNSSADATRLPRTSSPGELRGEVLYRKLGLTGETASARGHGESHIGIASLTDAEGIRLIHQAIDRGITFMDNSWDYNEGRSERLMGQALSEGGYRGQVFLMTKIDGRTKGVAPRQIETSLQRLKTDHIDLLQHHKVPRSDSPYPLFAARVGLQ